MVASEQNLYQTIVLPRKLATGSIHDYLFCYCPLVGILFEVLRIISDSDDNNDNNHDKDNDNDAEDDDGHLWCDPH